MSEYRGRGGGVLTADGGNRLRSREGRRRLARGAMLALGLLVASTFVLPAAAQEVGVAAHVNGSQISVFRLERHFEDYLRFRGRNVGAIRNPDVYKRLKREALDQLIDKELLWQEAQRRGIVVPDGAIAAERASIESGYQDPETFRRRLEESGFDAAGYGEYLRHELAARRAYGELVGDVSVGEEDVRRTLETEPAPPGMPRQEAERQVRAYLEATKRAEAGREALARLRVAATIEVHYGL